MIAFEWSLDDLFAKLELDGSISCAVEQRFLEMGGQIRVGSFEADPKRIRQSLSVARCNKPASSWWLFAKGRSHRRSETCSDPE